MSVILDKLLKGQKVEWKSLDEVFDILAGGDVPKNSFSDIQTEEFNVPILSNGIGEKSLYGWTDKAKINDPSLTISARGTIGWTSYQEKPFFPIVRLLVLTPKIKINLKYAYHFMKLIENNYNVSKAGIPQLTKPMIKDIELPIPPLDVQAKIVKILDAFTALTAELNAELTMREKQYHYYRDNLLTFSDDVDWIELGNVAKFINGRAYKQPELLEQGKYPVLRVGNFFTNANWYYSDLELDADKYANNGDLLYAWSASFGPRIWQGEKVIYHYHIWKVIPNEQKILKKFLYHILEWDTSSLKSEHSNGSTMMHITKGTIEQRLIPTPPLNEQKRIVAILDKFETITKSITEGLPKEIALRQKQYEYYREQLLDFPKE